jgi:hypothetical protein
VHEARGAVRSSRITSVIGQYHLPWQDVTCANAAAAARLASRLSGNYGQAAEQAARDVLPGHPLGFRHLDCEIV